MSASFPAITFEPATGPITRNFQQQHPSPAASIQRRFIKHPHALAVRIFKERSPFQAKPRIIRAQLARSSVFGGKMPKN
jgi:hypothetical protein